MTSTFTDASGIVRLQGEAAGGSARRTASATVTTDANTFYVEQIFDLGALTAVYVVMTALAFTPDGETFGSGAGEITVDAVYQPGSTPVGGGTSPDGITYYPCVPNVFENQPASVVGQVITGEMLALRFFSVAVFIYDNDSGLIYAGANNPTSQVRLDLEYI